MFIRIDDIRPLAGNRAGQLWILASYYDQEGGTLLSREQCHTYPVFATVVPRVVDGQLLCLDGRKISPEEATAVDAQIGFEMESLSYDPVLQIKRACEGFVPALRKASEILEAFASKSPEDLAAIAAGRRKYCEQMRDAAIASREPATAAKFQADLDRADAAAKDLSLLRQAAEAELAPFVRTMQVASAEPSAEGFTVDKKDSRGLLSVPEIAALVGSGWEVE